MLLAHSLRRPFRLPRRLPLALPFPPPLAPHSPQPPRPLLRSPLCPSLRCLHSPELFSRLNHRPEPATSPRRFLPEERPFPDGWAERAISPRRFRLPVALACLFRPTVAIGALNGVTAVGTSHEESEAAVGAAAAVARPSQRRRGKPKHDKEKDPGEPEQAAEDAYNEDGPPPVVILLDFETTGQGTTQNRIVELALRDVAGGRGAALHTLVNPFPRVISADAERVHGISMRMVNRPSVPHWREAGRLLVDFVEARRAVQAEQAAVSVHSSATTGIYVNTERGAGMRMGIMSAEMSAVSSAAPLLPPVVLVAHNGWSFDFPLLRNELQRVGIAVPPGWYSLDSMRLVQRLFKDTDRKPASKALGFLFSKHFHCSTPFAHPDLAHRAMADVDKLAEVLAAAMWERGVTTQQLLQYTKPFL
ncbi:unnamed protein product [Closterium sp. NIES-64]|nr:unnamed protein product [Closterium sp. NIES-64]CAI5970926.1 unnamed protein product [Closterium sp. NIES-64]CAI5988879.1 unnamed protein product [Closterium sp. NIES-64]